MTMAGVVLDTHVLHWWSAEPQRVSPAAREALERADELAVSSITWFELAWLAQRERITVTMPIQKWLDGLAGHVRTVGVTPAIAAAAAELPQDFAGDAADRLIYATAVERDLKLVTKDRRFPERHRGRSLTVW
jgi:PIN domain nuclease of toxin-antitoxin system